MPEARYRQLSDVSTQLKVSTSTLRRWSKEFAPFLSEAAGGEALSPQSEPIHRYTDHDLATLATIKELLAEGLTYEQVSKRLEEIQENKDEEEDTYALVSSEAPAPALAPAMTILSDALHSMIDGQQAILSSQQANRDLMGVVIQDNFNLKEENIRLRDRMLRLEQELSDLRRGGEERRGALEERLRELEKQLSEAKPVTVTEQEMSNRKGCLAGLMRIF